MRESGVDLAIRAAGGVSALARLIGVAQPSVSNWQRVPAERVIAIETATGVSRSLLRPDLYPSDMTEPVQEVDEVDRLRAQEYGLLALLLGRAPTAELLERLAALRGDATPLGLAHIALAEAAEAADADGLQREYFDLFIGLGRGEFLPYASYYLTGFLHERPLARVREDLARLGLERGDGSRDPEDHVAFLCEVMGGLAERRFGDGDADERRFFERHLKPWAARFFADLEVSQRASFYKAVGRVGRLFIEIETEAFAIDA
ncbi:MAG TPA: Cro/CI family transcriptional regulator [Beijerinckiaceae bacterium]